MLSTYRTGSKRKREPLRLSYRTLAGGASAAARSIQATWRGYQARRAKRARVGASQSTVGALSRAASAASTIMTRQTRRGVEQQEGANSLTQCKFGYLPPSIPRSIFSNLAPQVDVRNGNAKYTTSIGLQDAVSIVWNDAAGLYNLLTGITDKMMFHAVKAELMMVNSSSTNSTLTFYDVICKKDCSTSAVSTPLNAWLNGVDQAGGSATDYKVIGSIPTESILFNEYYKVVQRTRVSLAPGEYHRHEISYFPNRALSAMYLNNTQYGIGEFTCHTLVVHHGMPAHDSTTTTSVTIDASDLDVVTKTNWDYRLLESSTVTWNKTNNLGTTFAVGEQFVNEAVGQVQDAAGLHAGTLHS